MVGVGHLNHLAIIYCCEANSRLELLPTVQSRTNLGHISLFSYYTTLNNFLFPTTHQHSALSIHQVDWAETLGRITPHPSPSCSHPMEVFLPSGNCPDCPSIKLAFAHEPHLQHISTQAVEEIHHPRILNTPPTHTSSLVCTPSTSLILQEPANISIT